MPSLITLPTPESTAAQRVAELASKKVRLLSMPDSGFKFLFGKWQQAVELIWDDPNPQDVISALGTSAVEAFRIHGAVGACLESIAPGCTTAVASKIKPFTSNPDGSITINVPHS